MVGTKHRAAVALPRLPCAKIWQLHVVRCAHLAARRLDPVGYGALVRVQFFTRTMQMNDVGILEDTEAVFSNEALKTNQVAHGFQMLASAPFAERSFGEVAGSFAC